jgi:hypothetical protein
MIQNGPFKEVFSFEYRSVKGTHQEGRVGVIFSAPKGNLLKLLCGKMHHYIPKSACPDRYLIFIGRCTDLNVFKVLMAECLLTVWFGETDS